MGSRIEAFHQSYAIVFTSYMRAGAPRKTGRVPPTPVQIPRGGSRTCLEARDRWLVKPIRTTRKDWSEPVRLWRAECVARRQDGVSAPDACAGRMATSARMTQGQESMASNAESYQRGPWRRPDPRIMAGRPVDGAGAIRQPRADQPRLALWHLAQVALKDR
jgi:hypothetical protein